MSVNTQENVPVENKANDRELNFRKQEEMFKRQIEQERVARQQAEEKAARFEKEAQKRAGNDDDDDSSDEPYVDRKSLKKTLSKERETLKKEAKEELKQEMHAMMQEERKTSFYKQNADFNEVMSPDVLQKFVEKHPEIAENIMNMPEGFERQKLVYANIKALGVHKKEEPKIQDKIDSNRRSAAYQPSGISGPGYTASGGDFSPAGQKREYDKIQALKKNLRI